MRREGCGVFAQLWHGRSLPKLGSQMRPDVVQARLPLSRGITDAIALIHLQAQAMRAGLEPSGLVQPP